MSLEKAGRETSLGRTPPAPKGGSWRKSHLEQPKRLVYKKIIKPLMEKKRRDRIAHSLNQLKALLLEDTSQGNKPLPNARMDKAALLEMTVQRIQTLQLAAFFISERQQYLEAPRPSNSASKPTHETTSLATPPTTSMPVKISSWSDKCLASPGLRYFGRSVPSVILSKTGSQIFWRPWST
ncbi:transcription factor HES-5-like [Elgaria multicarinata webbii]|uniref:transcription factor HES-5-like n=1 Tax=Elgaria multicarinata webbii TaxID=159646 RepID=UPI002FCCD97A